MPKIAFAIDPKAESNRIIKFLRKTFKDQKIANAVIGLSGGIDSTTSLFLLAKAIPPQNIYPLYLPCFKSHKQSITQMLNQLKIPQKNFREINLNPFVNIFKKFLFPKLPTTNYQLLSTHVRLGNIMTRIRMIILFDHAKKYRALVCGTENKSERLLGYFTRFGDAASDIEPIRHLYKTQVYQLAQYLKVPKEIIRQQPTAGLWKDQTDEDEFGFTYEEADQVLHLHFEKKLSLKEIKIQRFPNAEKIISFAQKNSFKHLTPYTL